MLVFQIQLHPAEAGPQFFDCHGKQLKIRRLVYNLYQLSDVLLIKLPQNDLLLPY